MSLCFYVLFFFFNDTATTEIYTLSLHDALPICARGPRMVPAERSGGTGMEARRLPEAFNPAAEPRDFDRAGLLRSEEHTSELQSRQYLVCRLLLEKKKN